MPRHVITFGTKQHNINNTLRFLGHTSLTLSLLYDWFKSENFLQIHLNDP